MEDAFDVGPARDQEGGSFSFTAAMLNETAQEFVRPDARLQALVPFEPWNAEVLLSI